MTHKKWNVLRLLAGMAMLAQLCAFLGDGERASVISGLLTPFAGRNVLTGDRHSWGSACRYLGLLAFTEGRLDDAQRWQARAIDENTRWGSPPWAAYSQCELAETLLTAGDHRDQGRAAELGEQAASTARRLGLSRLLAAAEQTCRRALGEEGPPSSARRLSTMHAWSSSN